MESTPPVNSRIARCSKWTSCPLQPMPDSATEPPRTKLIDVDAAVLIHVGFRESDAQIRFRKVTVELAYQRLELGEIDLPVMIQVRLREQRVDFCQLLFFTHGSLRRKWS